MRLLKVLGLLAVLAVGFSSWGHAAGSEQPVFDDGNSTCQKTNCQTTCTGPLGVECCCYYVCRSGGTWVCQQGAYCDNTSSGCIFNTWP